ncbi:hypothetical protein H4R35_006372 [Dimargaris xerosporica]|nr:hypothetical protein H4R35_006372 [Dimargaris xerosporica]
MALDKTQLAANFIHKQYQIWQDRWQASASTTNKNGACPPPLLVAVQGLQGGGKTTLCRHLCERLQTPPYQLTAVTVSLDDFYLPFDELQRRVQQQHSQDGYVNPLLQFRGNPGTHDLVLGTQVLAQLSTINAGSHDALALEPPRTVAVPRYDKSLRQGRGDRLPPELWATVTAPVQVVLFEGWMVGFQPVPMAALTMLYASPDVSHIPSLLFSSLSSSEQQQHQRHRLARVTSTYRLGDLAAINHHLDILAKVWYPFFHAFICLTTDDLDIVYTWRLEQEHSLRAALQMPLHNTTETRVAAPQVLTDAQVRDFVDRYIPAYALYLPQLLDRGFFARSSDSHAQPSLFINVDHDRNVVDYYQR